MAGVRGGSGIKLMVLFTFCLLSRGALGATCPDVCIAIYAPVCGAYYKTYSNECFLQLDACRGVPGAIKLYNGRCVCAGTACPEFYAPVCGTNGRTYSNECFLNVADVCNPNVTIRVAYQGACTSNCGFTCPAIFSPVCGSDGVTYSNDCILSNTRGCSRPDLRKVYDGECSCVGPCPRIFAPVCGTDGNTYNNECLLYRASLCNQPDLQKAYNGECSCVGPCPRIFAPVCGTDGNTYNNECLLYRASLCNPAANIRIRHQGACRSLCNTSCTAVYNPVCGSDGKLYPSECELNRANCRLRNIIVRRRCDSYPNHDFCTYCPNVNDFSVNKPVCGTDGRTYGNECILWARNFCGNKKVYVAYRWKCTGKVNQANGIKGTQVTFLMAASLLIWILF